MIKRTCFFRISCELENDRVSEMSGVIYYKSIFSDAYLVHAQTLKDTATNLTNHLE